MYHNFWPSSSFVILRALVTLSTIHRVYLRELRVVESTACYIDTRWKGPTAYGVSSEMANCTFQSDASGIRIPTLSIEDF